MFAFGFMLLMMGTHFQDDEIVELNEPTGKKITYTQTNNINDEKPKNRKKKQKNQKGTKKNLQNKTMKIKKEENGKSNMKL